MRLTGFDAARAAVLVAGLVAGCGGGGTPERPPGNDDGARSAGAPGGTASPAPPVANFSFSVGEAYRASDGATPGGIAWLESFFEGALAPLREIEDLLPDPVAVVYDTCGTADAFHDPATATITLCHELALSARGLFDLSPLRDASLTSPDVAAYWATAFVLYHEIGHALDHQRDLPIAGNVESAADAIATVIAVETGKAHYAMAGAVLFLDTPLASGHHGGGIDRTGDIECWALGGDPSVRALLLAAGPGAVFGEAGRDCVAEFDEQRDTVRGWVPGLARLPGSQAPPDGGRNGPFVLEFGPSRLADAQGAGTASRDELEATLLNALAPLNDAFADLPMDPITVVYDACGAARSLHDRASRTVTICEELLVHHYRFLADFQSLSGVENLAYAVQEVYRAAAYTLYHEVGHLLHEAGTLPSTADVETTSDRLAVVLMVESGRGLYSLYGTLLFRNQPVVQTEAHPDVIERAYEAVCLTLGGDASLRALPEFAEAWTVYLGDGRDCAADYLEARDDVRAWLAGIDAAP